MINGRGEKGKKVLLQEFVLILWTFSPPDLSFLVKWFVLFGPQAIGTRPV